MTDTPPENKDELLRLFARFDGDGDGLIDESEFRKILQTLGEDSPDEVLSLEFAVIDANADGMAEFEEFRAWWLDYQ